MVLSYVSKIESKREMELDSIRLEPVPRVPVLPAWALGMVPEPSPVVPPAIPIVAVVPPVPVRLVDWGTSLVDCPTWENTEEPGQPCPACGSLETWWNINGKSHCQQCKPIRRALVLVGKVARIRRRKR
jgi:hypothetical protein